MNLETIEFQNKTIKIIDQKFLPQRLVYKKLKSLEDVILAIKNLNVRGAPAIGITAAYGFLLQANWLKNKNCLSAETIGSAAEKLKDARPTAINLNWAVEQMLSVFRNFSANENLLFEKLENKAREIHLQDKLTCRKIGEFGSSLLPEKANLLTHCNAGLLATGGMGTALAAIYKGKEQGKKIHVFVDETRPVGQGARLTYWELRQNKIPATLLADSMSAILMQQGRIDAVIVGADRIAANGDVANKIGTYALAVLANFHQIPFYVAAPLSSFDFHTASGKYIPIEYRPAAEILDFWNIPASAGYDVFNPAFDVTPHTLISAIITEKGIIEKPVSKNISKLSN